MKKIKEGLNNNKKILGLIFILLTFSCYVIAVKLFHFNYSIDRFKIVSICIVFLSLHFFIDIKKMYDFIYKKRYLIATLLLAFLVVNKWHGSSIGAWDSYIEPNIEVKDSTPFLGIPRYIRSDEWMSSVPNHLSQATEAVNFSKINSLMMAKDNNVTFYPRFLTKTFISYVTSIFKLPYFFLDTEYAFSFDYFAPLIALFLVTFELCMIITKKNKLYSLLGALMISLSPAVVWWNSPILLLYGELAVLIVYHFFNSNKWWKKLLFSIILGLVGACYILVLYPAWQVPYAYFFLGLLIWIMIESKEKLAWKQLLYVPITLLVIVGLVVPLIIDSMDVLNLVLNTVYPGKRVGTGGGNDYWKLLFTYFSNIYYSFKSGMSNPCEYSQYNSLFPLPLLMSCYYIFKHKKKDWFLIINGLLTCFLLLWMIIPMPILSKITLLSYSTVTRAQLVIGYASIFMLVRILSLYSDNTKISKKKFIIFLLTAIFITLGGISISTNIINKSAPGYLGAMTGILSFVLFMPIIFIVLLNNKKINKYLFFWLVPILVFGGLVIHPISKGLNILYEKPFAKEVKKIVEKDPSGIWIVADSNIIIPNYLIVNGAKTLNSTNYVPNFDLWNIIDPDKVGNNIYNRFAHIAFDIEDEVTSFELVVADNIHVNLSARNVCDLNISYIVFSERKEAVRDYKLIYENDNIQIYKTSCVK